MEEFGDDDDPDPTFLRVETTVEQLAKVNAPKCLLSNACMYDTCDWPPP